MAEVYLALGSNVGDRKSYITQAQAMLSEVLEAAVSAPLYESKAVGYTDQSNFMNTVVRGTTKLNPDSLLKELKRMETHIGRIKRFRWGPREIDIDIILYGDDIINQNDLTIPHPRFAERDFVLKPLCDLYPEICDPRDGQLLKAKLKKMPTSGLSIIETKRTN